MFFLGFQGHPRAFNGTAQGMILLHGVPLANGNISWLEWLGNTGSAVPQSWPICVWLCTAATKVESFEQCSWGYPWCTRAFNDTTQCMILLHEVPLANGNISWLAWFGNTSSAVAGNWPL